MGDPGQENSTPQTLKPCATQVDEGLRGQVDRLVALRPDLVLVERSVARGAQEALAEAGISLALNCKRSVLDMLARCTGAEVRARILQLNFLPLQT